MVFRADTGNNRKIVNFTYSCPLCLRKLLRNSQATFNLEHVNLLSNLNGNPENGVACIKEHKCSNLEEHKIFLYMLLGSISDAATMLSMDYMKEFWEAATGGVL